MKINGRDKLFSGEMTFKGLHNLSLKKLFLMEISKMSYQNERLQMDQNPLNTTLLKFSQPSSHCHFYQSLNLGQLFGLSPTLDR